MLAWLMLGAWAQAANTYHAVGFRLNSPFSTQKNKITLDIKDTKLNRKGPSPKQRLTLKLKDTTFKRARSIVPAGDSGAG